MLKRAWGSSFVTVYWFSFYEVVSAMSLSIQQFDICSKMYAALHLSWCSESPRLLPTSVFNAYPKFYEKGCLRLLRYSIFEAQIESGDVRSPQKRQHDEMALCVFQVGRWARLSYIQSTMPSCYSTVYYSLTHNSCKLEKSHGKVYRGSWRLLSIDWPKCCFRTLSLRQTSL